ncbi:hypothetical protein [Nonomuraea sediminis]|uniref:hypothetical protein n=1 Tax=Nonomuraea sediminis TaxID=2835864 RepID=UPI001BDD4DD6|nr:hypothetical protein [Nonomuraea sediminis]
MIPKLGVIIDAYRGPRTLIHGDNRLDNLLFRDDVPTPATVDWQTVGVVKLPSADADGMSHIRPLVA